MKYLRTIEVRPDQLEFFPGNARRHKKEQLRASARRFGQFHSVVVRQISDGRYQVLAGNGTSEAFGDIGAELIRAELIEVDSEEEAKSINLAANATAGDDDPDLLAALLEQIEDRTGLGFEDAEISKILAGDTMPDPGDAPVDDLGQRWGVIVECSDETDQVELLRELGDRGLNVRAIVA